MPNFIENEIQTAVSHPVLHAISGIDFCTKVFEHAKMARLRHFT